MSHLTGFFNLLHGTWSLNRSVYDAQQPDIITATGIATFTAHSTDEYLYREEGEMVLPHGQSLSFFRSYVYRLNENYLDVFYGDGPQAGQPYQSYTFDKNKRLLLPLATHICSADCYRGIYQLHDDNHFTLETTVKGPKKDYVINTAYHRAQD